MTPSVDAITEMTSLPMILLSLVLGCVVVFVVITLRWYFSKAAWPFHPDGSKGFFKDEFLRLGAIFLPYALLMVALKFYFGNYHPEMLRSPLMPLFFLSIILFRRLSVFVPFVREAGKRIDGARRQQREASFSS